MPITQAMIEAARARGAERAKQIIQKARNNPVLLHPAESDELAMASAQAIRKSRFGDVRVTQDEADKRPFNILKCLKAMTFGVWDDDAQRERNHFAKQRQFYKAVLETNDAAGGYVVPEEQNNQIIEFLREDAIGRRIGTTIQPMSRSTMTQPRITAGSTTSWGAESTTLTEQTSPTFGQIRLTAKKLFCRFPVSNEWLMDALPGSEAGLLQDIGAEMALAEDNALFLGSGIGDVPTGIVNVSGVTEVATVALASLTEAKLRALKLAVREAPANPTAWAMTPAIKDEIEQFESTAGQRIVQPDLVSGGPSRLFGLPIFETTELASGSTEYIFCGRWRDCVIGQRMNIEIETSRHVEFNTDQTMIRAIMRVDFALRQPGAFSFIEVT